MVLQEIKCLLDEVQAFLSSCCKETDTFDSVYNNIEQLSQCLNSDSMFLETKHTVDIPEDYKGMMCEIPVDCDITIKEEIVDGKPDKTFPKKNKNDGKIKKRRRPNLKDMPPDMKLTEEEEADIVDSRRRRYCHVCTKGFGNQKRLDSHLVTLFLERSERSSRSVFTKILSVNYMASLGAKMRIIHS